VGIVSAESGRQGQTRRDADHGSPADWRRHGPIGGALMGGPARAGEPSGPKFDDGLKAMFGAAAMFVYWGIVAIFTTVEPEVFGERQLSWDRFSIFTLGALALIVYFFLLATLEHVKALFDLFTSAIRGGATEDDDPLPHARDTGGRWWWRVVTNPWMPVTLSFVLAGWLTYATGGLANSPYVSVPFAMVMIGQNVYLVRPIERGGGGVIALARFVGHVIRLYWYPLLVLASLMLGVTMLQASRPLVTRPAPQPEVALATFVSFFLSMCVTLVTRLSDRNAAQRAS
jgi:hypothetical protein